MAAGPAAHAGAGVAVRRVGLGGRGGLSWPGSSHHSLRLRYSQPTSVQLRRQGRGAQVCRPCALCTRSCQRRCCCWSRFRRWPRLRSLPMLVRLRYCCRRRQLGCRAFQGPAGSGPAHAARVAHGRARPVPRAVWQRSVCAHNSGVCGPRGPSTFSGHHIKAGPTTSPARRLHARRSCDRAIATRAWPCARACSHAFASHRNSRM